MNTPPSKRTSIRRMPARGSYDPETIYAILDEGLVAHLGVAIEGQPYVIPTVHARIGDTVYFHGSAGSRTLRVLSAGVPACLTVSLIDGLVLARSAVHHSANYRSAVVLGQARAVESPDERRIALRAFMDRLLPGRWDEVRAPSEKDLRVTSVLCMSLAESSAKVRTGPPLDDEEDYSLDVWAGVIPLGLRASSPVPDARLPKHIEVPAYVEEWVDRHA